MNSSTQNQPTQQELESHVLSLKLYFRIFALLLGFFFVNISIYLANIPAPYSLILLLTVASIQSILVVLFFMELIHDDKFYFFIFISCILFIILFLAISLAEITGRNFFHPDEGAHVLRGFDQQGVYAPAGPSQKNLSSPETNE